MTKITISYRRDDSGVIAGRIFDRLVAHYGPDTVFRDIDNIPPGLDFRKYINNALATTDILLAIVGPRWTGRTADGRERIQDITDLVRLEVEAALRRDIPVIPVLVANAVMPQPSDLPDVLQDFAFRNAVKVDGLEDFDDHVRRLIRSMDRLIESQRTTQQQLGPLSTARPEPERPVETVAPVRPAEKETRERTVPEERGKAEAPSEGRQAAGIEASAKKLAQHNSVPQDAVGDQRGSQDGRRTAPRVAPFSTTEVVIWVSVIAIALLGAIFIVGSFALR